MKNGILLALLVLLTVASCRKHEYPAVLVEADSLCFDNPKAALKLLDSVGKTIDTTQTADWMYYRLVKVKAQDKAYLPHSDMNNIKQLVGYYEKQKDATLLPQAYFYAGRTCHDMNDAPQALDYFHATLDALEQTDDIRLKGLTHAQIGDVMLLGENYPSAREHFLESYHLDSIRKDTVGMIFDLRDIGTTCSWEEKQDTALQYLHQAKRLAQLASLSKMENLVNATLAGMYIEEKHPDTSTIAKYLLPLLQDIAPETRSSRYSMAVEYYFLCEQRDSAQHYINLLKKYGNIFGKRCAFEYDLKLNYLNTNSPAQKAFEYYLSYNDSAEYVKSVDALKRSQAYYDYTQQVKENEKLKHENETHKFRQIIMGFSIVLLVVLLYTFYMRNKMENMKQQERIKELQRLLNEFNNQKAEHQTHIENIKNTEIYQLFVKKAQNGDTVTKEEWERMESEFNQQGNDIKTLLYSLANLSEQEYHICLLLKMGFSLTAISSIILRSSSALTMARKRLYKKIFHKEGKAEELDAFIKSL